jgi:dCMP deaminase
MKRKFVDYFMDVAERTSKLSYAKRLQVGAIIVKDDRIVSIGYNGMPAGWDNNCEDRVWDTGADGWLDPDEFLAKYPYEANSDEDDSIIGRYGLKTKPEVLHAETNAIAKLARSTESGDGAVLFCTHAPCMDCAKLIYQSGISSVYYRDTYRDESGLKFLKLSGVNVTKHELQD